MGGHSPYRLGSKTLKATAPADNQIPRYDAATGRVVWEDLPAGGSGDMTEAEYNTLAVPGQVDTAAVAGDADTVDGLHASAFALAGHTHAQLHDATQQGAYTIFAHDSSTTYTASSFTHTTYTNTGTDKYVKCLVDFDLLNALFGAGNWRLKMRLIGARASGGANTLSIALYEEDGVLVNGAPPVAGQTLIGEQTVSLGSGLTTQVYAYVTGAFDSGTVPGSGVKAVGVYFHGSTGTYAYYLSSWVLYAERIA